MRPIDAHRLVTGLKAHRAYYSDNTVEDLITYNAITDVIQTIEEDSPTLDVRPVIHAHWTVIEDGDWDVYRAECSHCKQLTPLNTDECMIEDMPDNLDMPFCPHCGAEMNEEDIECD